MTNTSVLPHFKECVELSQAVYDQQGTQPFTADRLQWQSQELEVTRLLEFAIAYGLLSSDGTTYQLNCEPHAIDDCWETVLEDRVTKLKRVLHDNIDTNNRTLEGNPEPSVLVYDGDEFASVFVEKSDDFDTVASAVGTVDLDDWHGVVLRAPGDYANEVQRFADRLSDPSNPSNLPTSCSLRKESSDVAGPDKDSLEFRLYLRTA